MEQSSTIPKADDPKSMADVSHAIERMGRDLDARSVMFVERVDGSDMFAPVDVWDCRHGLNSDTARPGLVLNLGPAIARMTSEDHCDVVFVHGEDAATITGTSSGTAIVGSISGAGDLAVVLCYDHAPAQPKTVVSAVTQFCDLAGQIIMRARDQALLDDRLRLERALSRASLGLSEVDAASCEAGIGEHLGHLAALLGSTVATIWDDRDDGRVHRSHIWVNPAMGHLHDYPIDVIPVDHPISLAVRSLETGGVVEFSEHFSAREPRHGDSLVAAPLLVDGGVNGAVTFAFDNSAAASHDISFWNSAVAGFAALVTQTRRRVRAEQAENRSQQIEAAVGGIARMFVEAGSASFGETMDKAMKALGETIGAYSTSFHAVDPITGDLELQSTWASGRECAVGSDLGRSCIGAVGECVTCGQMTMPVLSGDHVVGQIACDLGEDRHQDPLIKGILSAVASLVAQFRRRCDAEMRLDERRAIDEMLREMASTLIGSSPAAQGAATKLLRSLGASHVSVWREHSGWRSSSHARVECIARADGRAGRSSLAIPLSLICRLEQPGEVLNRQIRTVPRWLRAIAGEGLDPAPRCISLATFRLDSDEIVILFVLSDGEAPVNEARREMMLRAVTMLAQHHARVAAEETFSAAFESAPTAIAIRDTGGRLISCNNAYVEFVGRPREELLGGRLEELLAEPGTVGEISEDESYSDLPYRRPSGEVVWGRARFSHVRLAGHPEPVLLSHIEDVTESRRVSQTMAHRATHDTLTDLPNRDRFFDLLSKAGSMAGSAVIVVDLDRFANINDSFGHHVGDMALITCTDRIRLALRPGDSICRLGGDEFAIHLASVAGEQEVAAVAIRLLDLMREPVQLEGHEIRITLSIGSVMGSESSSVAELVRCADAAMYRAKQTGRDRYVMFDDELRNELADHLTVESELREGLRTGQFEVHYQPEVDLDSGRILGTEALVRWNHPERGLLPAGEFIEVAEHSGLIVELGRWVLEQAAQQAVVWREAGHDIVMRANLSMRQLRPAVVDEIRDALLSAGLRPDHLCLEVTETAIMDDVDEAMRLLQQISDLGVKLAIDDFGTGYSSLAYLKRIPVDILKIDKVFVDGVGVNDQDTGIVETVIRLGRALDLEVVAEGIENARQIDDLRRLGCRRGQGFYMARPAPASHISNLLAETSHR